MPTMQGSYEVHMVEEGWQVFVIRQTSSLDTEVIVRLGEGRKHGRLWIADGADSSSSAPSLSDVRAQSTSRSLPIRARPTPTLSRVDELQVIPVSLVVH
jgi:hypothetical protein